MQQFATIEELSSAVSMMAQVSQNLPAQQLQQEVQSRRYFGVFAFHQHSEQETIVFLVVS